jgi:hypothetical protein
MGTLINAVICEVHQTKPQEKDSQLAIWSNSHCASQLWCNLQMQKKPKINKNLILCLNPVWK